MKKKVVLVLLLTGSFLVLHAQEVKTSPGYDNISHDKHFKKKRGMIHPVNNSTRKSTIPKSTNGKDTVKSFK